MTFLTFAVRTVNTMTMKRIFSIALFCLALSPAMAQTEAEIKAEMAPKKDSIAAIQSRVNALQSQLDALPGWKIGAFGTIGGSISQFDNWFAQGIHNNSSGNNGFTVTAIARLQEENVFMRTR